MGDEIYDICIIGGGPAGHSAAIYSSRSMLKTVLFEGCTDQGGQLTQTTHVENYPGFPDGILGYELCLKFREQSEKWGTEIISEFVESIEKEYIYNQENDKENEEKNNYIFTVNYSDKNIKTRSIIITTGSKAKKLSFQNSNVFWNRGITGCAVCHGALPMFRNKPLFVVGGGDTAMEDALFLSRYTKQVYIVHRRDKFRASKIMQERVFSNPTITILWDSEVIYADGDNSLAYLNILNNKTGETTHHNASGLFYAIGHSPSTEFLRENNNIKIDMDEEGYLFTFPDTSKTTVVGIFAAGDVKASDKKCKQAIYAAGSGCKAALEAIEYLS